MGQRICSIPGCEKSVLARGWCGTHYRRWHTHGDPGTAELLHRGSNPPPPCSLLDCAEPAVSNGMCHRHSENYRARGHAEPIREWPLIARLVHVGWDVTERGCWEWRGGVSGSGYGILSAPRLGLDGARVHRLMWEMHNGPISDGLVVRHRCDNPPCINPNHLEIGTHGQNMQDMVDRGRSLAYSTGRYDGVCVQGRHDVTQPGSLKRVAKKEGESYMTCVECDRERKRKHHEKRKAS